MDNESLDTQTLQYGDSTSKNVAPAPDLPLTGNTACQGEATGCARIVYSADEIHKVKQGDILVTTMTTPDLMLAIERCVGIVTDEGGILCHAAIISRELQIPCIIGTEWATQSIEDGDNIHVDAANSTGYVNSLSK